MAKRKCIFIIGMHRSGTSALTGGLRITGCGLGTKLLGPFADNPKGFFENDRIWKTNQAFLEQCNSSWDDPFLPTTPNPSPQLLADYQQEIKDIIKDEFPEDVLFGIKDPRISILLPIWKEVFQQLAIDCHAIIALRNPFESARSLQKRNNFSIERGLLMWLNYMVHAEQASRGLPRAFTAFENMLADPIGELTRISEALAISFPKQPRDCSDELTKFMDRGLKHHTQSTNEENNRFISMILDYFSLLLQSAASNIPVMGLEERTDELGSLFGELSDLLYHPDMTTLFTQHGQQTQQLQELRLERDTLASQLTEQSTIAREETAARTHYQNLVGRMEQTLAWRVAEFLRNLFPRRPKGN